MGKGIVTLFSILTKVYVNQRPRHTIKVELDPKPWPASIVRNSCRGEHGSILCCAQPELQKTGPN